VLLILSILLLKYHHIHFQLNQRKDEEVFTENFNHERKIAEELEMISDKVTQEWKEKEEEKTLEFLSRIENERRSDKEVRRESKNQSIATSALFGLYSLSTDKLQLWVKYSFDFIS
jgi:gamma-glutamyl:cysteine ligase YbdK (ATP-grasp superfamily)